MPLWASRRVGILALDLPPGFCVTSPLPLQSEQVFPAASRPAPKQRGHLVVLVTDMRPCLWNQQIVTGKGEQNVAHGEGKASKFLVNLTGSVGGAQNKRNVSTSRAPISGALGSTKGRRNGEDPVRGR